MSWRPLDLSSYGRSAENRCNVIATRNTNVRTCPRSRAQRSCVCPGNRWIPSIVEALRLVRVGSRPSSGTRSITRTCRVCRLSQPALFLFARPSTPYFSASRSVSAASIFYEKNSRGRTCFLRNRTLARPRHQPFRYARRLSTHKYQRESREESSRNFFYIISRDIISRDTEIEIKYIAVFHFVVLFFFLFP